ncbi:SIR2 family protein [Sorangium sp. So ce131]|uniref:WD40 domain-containing protein n=1 Tax=Sorangium sp. So ce131 TaxID=3133282 RepID=UPI003F5FDBD5
MKTPADPVSSPMEAPVDPVLQDLRRAYESGQLVLFVGADVPAAAGLPDWRRLTEQMAARLRARGASAGILAEIEELAQKQRYIEALSAVKLALGAPEFCAAVEQALDDGGRDVPEIARVIASMRPKLRAVLTTNLDRLLERAFEGEWDVLARAPADIAARRGYILKLHGTLRERDTWVFTREQYDRVIFASPGLQVAIKALFHACPILFVGFSFADDNLDHALGEIRALAGEQPPPHFALLPEDTVTPFRRRRLEAAGVRIVAYESPDSAHARVAAMLRWVARGGSEGCDGVIVGAQGMEQSDFLTRVERVCRLKEPEDASIERLPAPPPFGALLRVSARRGRIVRTHPVAAIEQPVTDEMLQAFLERIDAPYRRDDPGLVSTLVYRGNTAPESLVRAAERARVNLESFIEYQGLLDFTHYLERQTQRLSSDLVYPPSLYVEQRLNFKVGLDELEEADALSTVAEWLDSPRGRFVVLLGDFGTGKTFLLHELARRMGAGRGPVVPVLVEMRSLEKGRTLEELLAQHFARARFDRFQMEAFLYMLSEGRIALLFDGFDELALRVSFDRAEEHFDTLIQAASGNAKVVVTSRTQHFLSDRRVETALAKRAGSLPGYRLAKLSPFTEDQIRRFLVNRLGGEGVAERRFKLLGGVKDLLGLARNPRMLGFIAGIDESKLTEAAASKGEVTSAELYRLLLEQWLRKEDERAHPRGAQVGLTLEQRWQAVTELAVQLWQRGERTADVSALSPELLLAAQELAASKLDAGVVAHEIGAGTLLVRDEEGSFSFVHQSVLEWLVARRAAEDVAAAGEPASLSLREMSELMADFFAALAGADTAVTWARAALASGSKEVAKKNALLVLKRLGVEAHVGVNLAGHDLRGRDLSRQDLRGADLTGADLTGARLVEADLRGASLERAVLQRADLSRARLGGANLRAAELSFARLLGADLRDASLAGARLRAAELVGAELSEGALDGCVTAGAAMPEPAHVEPMIAPASDCSAVAFSPDGVFLASGHANGSVRIWDLVTGVVRVVLVGHEGSVQSMAWSVDSGTLASGSEDGTIRLWDVARGAARLVLRGHGGRVCCVAFSPDGAKLASGWEDATIWLWDVASGAVVNVIEGYPGAVPGIAWSPDGSTLASAHEDFTVRLWDAGSGSARAVFSGHQRRVQCVAWSPDGATVASSSYDSTIRLWEVATGSARLVLKEHKSWVVTLAWSPDGSTLASGSYDSTVRLWNASTGAAWLVLRGHGGLVAGVAWSPDGATLASASLDGTIRLWDASTGAVRLVLASPLDVVWSVALDRTGGMLATGSQASGIRLWDMTTSTIRRGIDVPARVWSLAFSPDGATLASRSEGTTVQLWDVASGAARLTLEAHASHVLSVAWSPDGAALATGSQESGLRLWDTGTGDCRLVFRGHQAAIWSVAFSPDGKMLASGSGDSTIRLWDGATAAVRHVLADHQGLVRSVAWSPDGATLASGSYDATIRLWDVMTGACRLVLKQHQGWVMSVAWSPDGTMLASGSGDSTVRLWDAARGAPRLVLRGHQSGVASVAFSADGCILASGSGDSTVRLWDVATGACLAVLLCVPEGWAAFTPSGRYKLGGDTGRAFWYATGLCRFEPGELDPYVPSLCRVRESEPLYERPSRQTVKTIDPRAPHALLRTLSPHLAQAARLYGVGPDPEEDDVGTRSPDLTVSMKMRGEVESVFKLAVEVAFLIVSCQGILGPGERPEFVRVVANVFDAVDLDPIASLVDNLAESLARDGLELRMRRVAWIIPERGTRFALIFFAALVAQQCDGIDELRRSALDKLAHALELPHSAVASALKFFEHPAGLRSL